MKKKKPISIASRKAKGRKLQQWICEKISSMLNIPWGPDEIISSRGGGQSGTDVVLLGEAKRLFPFSIEAKSQETYSMPSFIKQAKDNKLDNTDWLLIIKRKNEDPTVTMDADSFFKIVKQTLPKKNYFDKEVTYDKDGIDRNFKITMNDSHENKNNSNYDK